MKISRMLAIGCLLIGLGIMAPDCMAQEAEPETGPASRSDENVPADASHETDVSEDNYRRYMELRDQQVERDLSAAAFVRPASLEKMQNLPEASQKHLRNELRDAIVQNGQWSPAQRDAIYSHSPSEAAMGNEELQAQEAEAWRELVAEYHEREAAIYANSARSQAASAAGEQGEDNGSQGSSGQAGSSGMGTASQERNSSESDSPESIPSSALSASSFSPDVAAQDGKAEAKGVEQNALAYIQAGSVSQEKPDTPASNASSAGMPGQGEPGADRVAAPGQVDSPAGHEARQANTTPAIEYVSPGTLKIEDLGKVQGVFYRKPVSGRYLNGAELRALLVGNTVTGSYPNPDVEDSAPIRFHQYADPDGTLVLSDEHRGISTGTWRIREDGCNDTRFDDSDESDGCYYYRDNGDGTFSMLRPGSDEPGILEVLLGNPQHLERP